MLALRFLKGAFFHPEYERLRESVFNFVLHRRHDPELLDAIDKNLDRALLRGDFLLAEQSCREHLQASHTVTVRNYWVSVLYAILARLGKL